MSAQQQWVLLSLCHSLCATLCHSLCLSVVVCQVEAKIMKDQRRMILMEQLKSIKRELGLEKDDKATLIGNFQAKWEPKKEAAPEEVRK
jgi:ATP-dependent Lon protease